MPRAKNPYERACVVLPHLPRCEFARKICYPNRGRAKRALAQIKRHKSLGNCRYNGHIYKCGWCDCFHVGSSESSEYYDKYRKQNEERKAQKEGTVSCQNSFNSNP